MRFFCLFARAVFGLIFIFAGATKIVAPSAFAEIIFNYQILPENLVNVAAITLPWLEILCGLALILGFLARGAAVVLCALLAAFIAAMGFNLWRGLDTACGCFSSDMGGGHMARDLARDLVFLALGLIAAWCAFHRPRDPHRRRIPFFPHPRVKRSST